MLVCNSTVITILNKILKHNLGSRIRLQEYSGKNFKLNWSAVTFIGTIDNDGFIINSVNDDYAVIVTLPTLTPLHIFNQDQTSIFKQLAINGEVAFAKTLLDILTNLQFNVIPTDLSPFQLLVWQQLMVLIKLIKRNGELFGSSISTSCAFHLLYQTKNVVSNYELTEFYQSVENLTLRTNKLLQIVSNK
jgi:ubiquinone biosynthesis protein UbiJ